MCLLIILYVHLHVEKPPKKTRKRIVSWVLFCFFFLSYTFSLLNLLIQGTLSATKYQTFVCVEHNFGFFSLLNFRTECRNVAVAYIQ